MLDVLGDEYIAQHIYQCIAQEFRERLYRRYITDALYCISNRNAAMSVKWSELDTGWERPQKEEDPETIKSRIMKKVNGEEEPDESI